MIRMIPVLEYYKLLSTVEWTRWLSSMSM